MASPLTLENPVHAPFLSKPMTFIRGQDPLGLQNTSEATFALLLPGLNNVTARIRLYSLYCWLLQQYAKEISNISQREQRKYIRRAELMLALINRSSTREVNGIPGTDYANSQLEREIEAFDLQSGTYDDNGLTIKTYWQHPAGVFGQYYVGALTDIGLVALRDPKSKVYVRTPSTENPAVSGERLAQSVEAAIDKENKRIFLAAIKAGQVKREDLKRLLHDFNLVEVSRNANEGDLLLTLMLQHDYPWDVQKKSLTFRRQTLKHILYYAYNIGPLTDRNFTRHAYQNQGIFNSLSDECMLGWYYYELNEYWNYANVAILNSVLHYLNITAADGQKNVMDLVMEVTRATMVAMGQKVAITQHEEELINEIKRTELADRIANCFILIKRLYERNKLQLDRLQLFSQKFDIQKDGNAVQYFKKVVDHLTCDTEEFIKNYIYKNILLRHQYVAYKKIGNGAKSTQLFIMEDGYIRYENNFDPGWSGPRIGRLISFLTDLGILDQDTQLTNKGKELLSTLAYEND